jgi:phage/plasmid primase-like uncharacterized protein
MIRKALSAAAVLMLGTLAVAADVKSGPQPGEKMPGAFHPLNINGQDAGRKACLYCKAGDCPTVAVFARSADDAALQKLIAMLEAETAKNAKAELNSFVVFCSDNDKLADQLKEQAQKGNLKHVILAIESVEGPDKYKISKEAEVTVILYRDYIVKSNYTFGKGKMTDKDVETIAAEIAKLVK